ncbi:MAG: branched-chain amino acid aminotransferase [Clostridiales bacterium]|nr:branched-chain amino acid aminotransferase [Clostridiales bacterium]
MNIRIEKASVLKQKPEAGIELGFGNYFTDHMFIADYEEGKGWHDLRIVPYQPLTLDPSVQVFHYAQEVFEGLKAYKSEDNRTLLFRPDQNAARMKASCARVCLPEVPEDMFVEAVSALVKLEEDWIPKEKGTSLYIRPFVIATDSFLGIRIPKKASFIIILSPVGNYYPEGLNPVKIWVEDEYVRAVRGGTGAAKVGGNYAASLLATKIAHEAGFTQVLWLDGQERKYIEEVGSMNIFFKINGTIIAPALNGTILPGITRKSCLELIRSWGMPVEERRLSLDEVIEAAENGTLEEIWGSGTAAVISPVGMIHCRGKNYTVQDGGIGEVSQKLYDAITGIQQGRMEGPEGWVREL